MKRVYEGDLDDWEWFGRPRRAWAFQQEPAMNHGEGEADFKSLIPGLPDELAIRCLARVSSLASLRGVCQRWQEVLETSEELLTIRAEIGERAMEWLYTLVRRKEGSFAWYAYDPLASKWHTLAPMPEDINFQLLSPGSIGLSHAVQCVSTKKKLVMLAGLRPQSETGARQQWSQLEPALEHPWVFDTEKCQWRKGQKFNTPRKWCVCGVVDDQVYVASGCGKLWNVGLSRSTDKYDPEADAWESLPGLGTSRFSGEAITAVNVQGKLHMTSGNGVFFKEGAVFCPVTRKWSKMHYGLKKGWTGSCVAVNDNFFVLDEMAGKLNIYDSVQDRWKLFMADPRLKGLTNLTGENGKICALIRSLDGWDEVEGSCVRIIDVVSKPPCIFDLDVPQGKVVSMHILSRMSSSTC